MFLLGLVVSAGIGFAWGGPDRTRSARTAALTAIPVSAMLFVDRLMQSWASYNDNGAIKGRPIATLGSTTPNLEGDFWIQTIDTFTHLLLPTATLILISFAAVHALLAGLDARGDEPGLHPDGAVQGPHRADRGDAARVPQRAAAAGLDRPDRHHHAARWRGDHRDGLRLVRHGPAVRGLAGQQPAGSGDGLHPDRRASSR